MIIDGHTHIFHKKIKNNREDYFYDDHFKLLNSDKRSKLIDHTELLNDMKENEIDKSVVLGFPWFDEKDSRDQNIYFSQIAQQFPDKLYPFGTIAINIETSISHIIEEISALGLKGIGEVAFYRDGFDKSAQKKLEEILEISGDLGLIVNIHINEPIGHIYSGKYDPNFSQLYKILINHQNCKTILSHWGGGLFFYELMKEVKENLSHVYYDTAASPYLYNSSIYKHATGILGSDKIIFGTDYPLISPNRYFKEMKECNLEIQDIHNIQGNNMLKLLNIK